MATLELPTLTDGTAHYDFRTRLDEADYVFEFRYDERREGWTFSLATLDGESLLRGQLVTVARNFLRRISSPNKPPGVLFAINTAVQDNAASLVARPGLYDLGPEGRCKLYYEEAV